MEGCTLISALFPFMATKLKQILSDILTSRELDLLVGSYDVVGDIAIIIIPDELRHKERQIGRVILGNNSNIKVVLKRDGNYQGEFRTIPLKNIGGESRKETLVTEFGVRLLVDVENTYFSVRSGSERRRITSLVAPQETVLVMFSGIAPFPLLISRYSEAKEVVGIEKNPIAHEYALKNLQLNKKLRNVKLFSGDVREVAVKLAPSFDRIVMPLPTRGYTFLPNALGLLKPNGGFLHYYEMAREGAFDVAVDHVRMAVERAGRELRHATITRCGHCGPRTYRVCVDAEIC